MTVKQKVKNWFGVQDMTIGNPMNGLIRFSVPLLIGNLAQQLYNTVDSIVVGKYIGDTALSAVGTSGPILNLLLVLFMGIATGASILSAQCYGAKNREELSNVVGGSIFLTITSAVLMSLIGVLTTSFLVSLVAPPAEVAEGAVIYLRIIFLGFLGSAAYNILSGVLRGIGDSVSPLIYLVIASLLNIALDLLFVRNFGMGVAGVALATIIAQAVSGSLCLIRLCRMRDVVDVRWDTVRPKGQLIRRLCLLGLPAGITSAIYSLSAMIVQSLTNSIGVAMIAANVAVMRVDGFAMMPNFTFGTAATTYVGQNIGAEKGERVRAGVPAVLKLALGTACVLVACILLFGHNLIQLFTNTPEVIALGQRGLRWLAVGYICFAVTQVLQGVMRGAGETVIPMWISISTTIILRMPLAYLLAYLTKSELWPNGHPDAIFASLLTSWVVGMLATVILFRKGNWKKKLPENLRNTL